MRISRDEMFMEIAHIVARRGTCSRAQVGAIIVRDRRIVSMGYNGVPAGQPHCIHEPHNSIMAQVVADREGCTRAIHAELNAIAWASRVGVPIDSCTMYATHSSCAQCARAMVAGGITTFWFETPYRLTEGLHILEANDVRTYRWTNGSGSTQDAEGSERGATHPDHR